MVRVDGSISAEVVINEVRVVEPEASWRANEQKRFRLHSATRLGLFSH